MENPCIHDSHKNVVEVDKEEGVKRGEQNVLSLQSGRVERGLKDIEKQYTLVLILVAMICTVNITEVVEGGEVKQRRRAVRISMEVVKMRKIKVIIWEY